MFTQTEDIDVPDNDHLFVILCKDCIVDRIDQPLLVSLRHPQQGFRVPLGCSE